MSRRWRSRAVRGEVLRVMLAELKRHSSTSPFSFWMATVVFPFLTVLALYYLPSIDLRGTFCLQRGGVSLSRAPNPKATEQNTQDLEGLLGALENQRFYRFAIVPDAVAALDRDEVDVALVYVPPRARVASVSGPSRTSERSAEGRLEVHRRHDFFSDLFMSRLQPIVDGWRQLMANTSAPEVLVANDRIEAREARDARSRMVQTAPFILLGFAWFFVTVGTVEAFVTERERRTLELLLAAPVGRDALALGKLGFVVAQATLVQLASTIGFVLVGFSPWVFCLTALVGTLMVPGTVICFWYFRNIDSTLDAGWRNGVIFVLGFPLIILTDDVLGTLSPLYHLGKTFWGPPSLAVFGTAMGASILLAWRSGSWLRGAIRGWQG